MEASFPIPKAIQDFLALKPSCPQIPLLPCIYTDFEEMQMGFRYDPVKDCSLVSDKDGAWKESWYVIAQNALGDPFFVDINEQTLPVFTAMIGAGTWNPIPVADSPEQFMNLLKTISETELIFPCNLDFLGDMIDRKSPFWIEVNESCEEE